MEDNTLKLKTHEFIRLVYQVTQNFPKHELYGLTSQIRRAAVSVMLNFLEGYARRKPKVKLNFWEISFGSIKECKYIIYLSRDLNYISENDYKELINLAEEISAMFWRSIEKFSKKEIQEE